MTYRELRLRLEECGAYPMAQATLPGDPGKTVFLGDPARISYPNLARYGFIPEGAVPVYLSNGDSTILESGHAQYIIDHFCNSD